MLKPNALVKPVILGGVIKNSYMDEITSINFL